MLQKLLSRVCDDPSIHIEMANLHRRAYFDAQNRAGDKWRNGHWTCMHPECNDRAIGSHTLQKKNSLEAIADPTSRVVVSPRFDPAVGDRVGTNLSYENASVFRGFCEKHDRELFLHLEEMTGAPDPLATVLQCCRTFCRERLAQVHAFEASKNGYDRMVRDQHEAIGRRLEALSGLPLSTISGYTETERLQYRPDNLERIRHLASAQATFLNSFDKLAGSVGDFFCDRAKPPHMFIKSWALSNCLDFALSGSDDIGLPGAPVPMFYFVMPRSGVTHLGAFCHIEDEAVLTNVLEEKEVYDLRPGDNGIALFRFFEQLMIDRTNHWFLRPSAWAALSDSGRQILISEVNIHDRSLYSAGTKLFPSPEKLEVTRNVSWRPRPL